MRSIDAGTVVPPCRNKSKAPGLEKLTAGSDYCQPSAFVEMFRRTFGTTPKVWISALNNRSSLQRNPSLEPPTFTRWEAQGFKALLDLEDPIYSIEQIAAKAGKQPAFVAARLKLIDLVPAAVETFYRDEIGVGHALLLAKLPADQQEQALSAWFREDWVH